MPDVTPQFPNRTMSHLISVILIDDESHARQTLRGLLADCAPDFRVIAEAKDVRSGLEVLRRERPDVVFLDIQMPDGTGFDMLDQLPGPGFHLIFTTAFDHFALKAFRYHAVDYLVKPVDPDELQATCRRIREQSMQRLTAGRLAGLLESFRRGKADKLTLSTSEGLVLLPLEEIVRLEASDSYTSFFTRSGERTMVARTLKNFDDLLPKKQFFRVHQSHLINLDLVRKVMSEDGDFAVMEGGAKVPVARRRKEAFLKALSDRSL